MFVRFFNFLRGYVFLGVRGFFLERFLNLCLKKDICLWDVKYGGENSLEMKMSINGFKKVRGAAYKTRSEVKIKKRAGLPFIIQKYKKRKAFAAGFLIAVILFSALSSFIWRIDVTGNEKVPESVIINRLAELGFKVGTPRFNVDVYRLQNEILKKEKSLSWLWVDIKGTHANVSVKEKVPAPEMADDTVPSNIVASKDGLVTRVVALNGEAAVREGDIVDKGDLLISGIVSLGEAGEKIGSARGEVTARTWYSKDGEFPLEKIEYIRTDKKISKNTVNFFGFDVSLYIKDEIPYEFYDKESKTSAFHIGRNFFLPMSHKKDVYYEKNKIETKLTTEGALVYYGDIIKKELDKEIGKDIKVVNASTDHMMQKNGKIYIKVTYECIQSIGENVKIENGG